MDDAAGLLHYHPVIPFPSVIVVLCFATYEALWIVFCYCRHPSCSLVKIASNLPEIKRICLTHS